MGKVKTEQAEIEPILSDYESLTLVNEPLDLRIKFKILTLILKTCVCNHFFLKHSF